MFIHIQATYKQRPEFVTLAEKHNVSFLRYVRNVSTKLGKLICFRQCYRFYDTTNTYGTDNNVNNQQDATTFSFINLFKSTQHVSGDKFAHPQEHFLTVYTAFGTMHCNDKL